MLLDKDELKSRDGQHAQTCTNKIAVKMLGTKRNKVWGEAQAAQAWFVVYQTAGRYL